MIKCWRSTGWETLNWSIERKGRGSPEKIYLNMDTLNDLALTGPHPYFVGFNCEFQCLNYYFLLYVCLWLNVFSSELVHNTILLNIFIHVNKKNPAKPQKEKLTYYENAKSWTHTHPRKVKQKNDLFPFFLTFYKNPTTTTIIW